MILRSIALVTALAFSTFAAQAAATCEARAAERKLAGAAKTSFITKCEKDAKAGVTCDSKAAEKKLHGAAKTSFITKCEKDAKGGGDKPKP